MKQPPKLAHRLLRLYCSEERLEELEGDFYEIFQVKANSSLSAARWHYWWMVIKGFRRYALKNSKSDMIQNIYSFLFLFKHHLLIALRQSWKHRTVTLINVLGLSIGLSSFIAISSIYVHEHSYNRHIPEKDKIYRIYTEFTGSFTGTNRGVSAAVPSFLRSIESSLLSSITGFHTRTFAATIENENRLNTYNEVSTILTDPDFFDVFKQYEWIEGNASTALTAPNQVVLSIEQAQKYFGRLPSHEYLNLPVIYDDSLMVYVSGIVHQLPGNTDFDFGDFISLSTIHSTWLKKSIDLTNWDNTNSASQLWFRANLPLSIDNQEKVLQPLNEKSTELEESEYWVRSFNMKPLSDMHFDQNLSIFDGSIKDATNKRTLTMMLIVSISLLSLAIINFVNLEIAQYKSKMKEVGVRKVLGGHFSQLVHRFLTASFLTTILAAFIAIPLSYYGLYYFQDQLSVELTGIIDDFHFIWIIGTALLVVGIISGIYPAVLLSRFNPKEALYSFAKHNHLSSRTTIFKKAMVAFQFVCSQLLIVGSMIIYLQLDYMREKEVGFDTKNIMYLHNPWNAPNEKYQLLDNKLREIPELTELVNQQSPPASNSYSSTIAVYKNGDSEISTDVYKKWGDAHYLDFYGIKLLSGQQIQPVNQSNEIIINDTYRKTLGFSRPEDAIGIRLDISDEEFTVIGVMEDFHFSSMAQEISPMMFEYSETKYGIAGKFKTENLQAMMEKVTSAYQSVYPNQPVQINFLDKTLLKFYETEAQMSRLTVFATVIAIIISGMGLFGLISFSIVHRTKEIGIRKVLGADAIHIARIIVNEFIVIIFLALIISIPIIYLMGSEWLNQYAYAIDLQWWIYVLGALISIAIALLISTTKVIGAVKTNPVASLRYE